MASSIARVDLSEQAADFRRLALQPGMGLIDKGGAHAAILRKWRERSGRSWGRLRLRLPALRRAAAREVVAQVDRRVLRHELGGGLHVAVHERVAVLEEPRQLLKELHDALLVSRVPADDELVALSADPDTEEGLDVLEVGVARSVERFDAGLRQDDSLHAFC